MAITRRFGQIFPFCFLYCWSGAFVQAQEAPVKLNEILPRIEANTESYRATVPSFICDEHITSQELHGGKLKRETTVDAEFSVLRSPSKTGILDESRETKKIDGKPSGNSKIKMPLSFSGGFSGALTKFLSADHRECFDYREDAPTVSSTTAIAVTFVARDAALKEPSCQTIQQGTTGKFVVDVASMQVIHIERTVPNPIGKDQAVLGTASVDYAPVLLNGKSFWLPTTITAFTTETPKTNGVRFTARYSNYHRFASTSKIVSTTPNLNTQPSSE